MRAPAREHRATMSGLLRPLALLLLLRAAAGGDCEEARMRCSYRANCARALHSYMVDCADVLAGRTSRCPWSCKRALISLASSEAGLALSECECGDNEFCRRSKERAEVCRPEVSAAVADGTVVACAVAEWICAADHLCSTALEYYHRLCRPMFLGRKCTLRCNNSLAILDRQPKAGKLRDCYCDGSEDFPCPAIKRNTRRLCHGWTEDDPDSPPGAGPDSGGGAGPRCCLLWLALLALWATAGELLCSVLAEIFAPPAALPGFTAESPGERTWGDVAWHWTQVLWTTSGELLCSLASTFVPPAIRTLPSFSAEIPGERTWIYQCAQVPPFLWTTSAELLCFLPAGIIFPPVIRTLPSFSAKFSVVRTWIDVAWHWIQVAPKYLFSVHRHFHFATSGELLGSLAETFVPPTIRTLSTFPAGNSAEFPGERTPPAIRTLPSFSAKFPLERTWIDVALHWVQLAPKYLFNVHRHFHFTTSGELLCSLAGIFVPPAIRTHTAMFPGERTWTDLARHWAQVARKDLFNVHRHFRAISNWTFRTIATSASMQNLESKFINCSKVHSSPARSSKLKGLSSTTWPWWWTSERFDQLGS